MNSKEKLLKVAKAIRVLTVPPVMVGMLILVLMLFTEDIIRTGIDAAVSFGALAAFPALAYPLCAIVPAWREQGRQRQRKTALILTPVGYAAAFAYGMCADCSNGLRMIYLGYLLAALILLAVNRLTPAHASGHACSIAGPIVYAAYFLGLAALVPGAVLYFAIMWASLIMKRHTLKEFIYGTLTCCAAFGVSCMMFG